MQTESPRLNMALIKQHLKEAMRQHRHIKRLRAKLALSHKYTRAIASRENLLSGHIALVLREFEEAGITSLSEIKSLLQTSFNLEKVKVEQLLSYSESLCDHHYYECEALS